MSGKAGLSHVESCWIGLMEMNLITCPTNGTIIYPSLNRESYYVWFHM
jgi:hypothetical protein